jgi:hypothetical protein
MSLKAIKLLTGILTILFVTNSCKKSDKLQPGNVVLSGVYQMGNVINLSPIKMYTVNGEVTDQAVIKDYARRYLDTNYFIFDKTAITYNFGKSEIDFSAADIVTWTGAFPPPYLNTSPSRYTISQRSSDGFMLEAVDSTQLSKDDYGSNRAMMLFDNSNTLKVFSNCGPVICANNTCSSNCTYRQAFPFIVKNGQISLQLYGCSIKCSQPGTSAISVSQLVGSFDMALIKQLAPGDTVLFQNKTIQFNKK